MIIKKLYNMSFTFYLFFSFLFSFTSCFDESEEIIGEKEMEEEIVKTISSYANFKNSNEETIPIFTMGHASDIHNFNSNSAQNLSKFLFFFQNENVKKITNTLVITGDLSNGYATRSKNNTITEIQHVTQSILKQDIPTLLLVGNHDSNINETAADYTTTDNSYKQAINKQDQYNFVIKDVKNKWNLINENEEVCYYYKDYPSSKIRIISLDFIDYPIVPNPEQVDRLKYPGNHILSQKQLDWFYKTLKSIPNDYGLIIAIHSIPGTTNLFGKWSQESDMLLNIINAFKTGTQYSHKWDGGKYPELATNVDFDFTENGEKEFICWIGGHTHRREYIKEHNQLMISTAALYTQIYKDMSINKPLTYRKSGTDTQNSFNIIQINRNTKEVVVTVYGAYIDTQGHVTQRTTNLSY